MPPKKLPTTGSEPLFRGPYDKFATQAGVLNNNCYGYAIGVFHNTGGKKLQPGNLTQKPHNNALTCDSITRRVMADLNKGRRHVIPVKLDQRCPNGYGKLALIIDPNDDYHWLLQHQNVVYQAKSTETLASIARKFWVPMQNVTWIRKGVAFVRGADVFSHKRGLATPPLLYDARGRPIFDPRKANFDYGNLDYTKMCNGFCYQRPSPTAAKKYGWNKVHAKQNNRNNSNRHPVGQRINKRVPIYSRR